MIDVKTLISVLSLLIAIISTTIAIRRGTKSDDANEASQMTTVIVKLENIDSAVKELQSEMRTEMKSIKADVKEDHDRLIKVEASSKQLWHQLEEIKAKSGTHIQKDEE